MAPLSSQPKNVLFIASATSGTGIAGGEVYLLSVMRHLDRSLYNPIVLLPGDGVAFRAELAKLNTPSIVVPLTCGWLGPDRAWYSFLSDTANRISKISEIIDEYQIDLVHTNSNIFLDGGLAARLKGIHHILMVHIPFMDNQPLFQRLQLTAASFASLINDISDYLIAVSEPTADSLRVYLPAVDIGVINVGLELDIYQKAADATGKTIRQQLAIAPDAPLVVSVGRIHPDKGFEVLVEAAALVLQQHPDAHFLVLGAMGVSDYQQQLDDRIAELGIQDHVHFLGFRQDVPEILSQCDIFALSSVSEGGPYVLLEAMACRCAAVATRCGGIVEKVVFDSETGYLIDVGDSTAMAGRITMLLADASLRQQLADNGYQIVAGHFDAKQSIQKLMDAYAQTLAKPAKQTGIYAVLLFRQTAQDLAQLGLRLDSLSERFSRVENLANKILDSRLYASLRALAHRLS